MERMQHRVLGDSVSVCTEQLLVHAGTVFLHIFKQMKTCFQDSRFSLGEQRAKKNAAVGEKPARLLVQQTLQFSEVGLLDHREDCSQRDVVKCHPENTLHGCDGTHFRSQHCSLESIWHSFQKPALFTGEHMALISEASTVHWRAMAFQLFHGERKLISNYYETTCGFFRLLCKICL